mgnify:CR=1 FL=1
MPLPLDALEAEVLNLPAVERSHLLDRLIASFETAQKFNGRGYSRPSVVTLRSNKVRSSSCRARKFSLGYAQSFGDVLAPPRIREGTGRSIRVLDDFRFRDFLYGLVNVHNKMVLGYADEA